MAAPNLMKKAGLRERQDELVQANIRGLVQALNLLERINDQTYVQRPAAIPHTVGGHMRHILEFYECLLDGLDGAHIDYDSRRRDESIARNRFAAMARIRSTIERLECADAVWCDPTLFVRIEDADGMLVRDPYLASSAGRELMVLSSHTVHHMALIAVTLQCLGIQVDTDLGVAPATLRYRAQLEAIEAQLEAVEAQLEAVEAA